jgi:AraC-like DNA-binding protein/DNA-binding NarL/FixJ family response regulator
MSAAGCRLLIADDEYWARESLMSLVDWSELSIELVEPAENGEDALRRLEVERPDILITDINMPFVNGNELIRVAKERYPRLQIIVLSGYSDFAFVRDALLHGAVDYLLKPVTRSALVDVLAKTLGLLSSGRERERADADLREKLLEATSILRDGEMSAVISEDAPERPPRGAALDLDLEFASFTLVLAKLVRPSGARGRTHADISRLSRDIKDILAKSARGAKHVAFHNVYARNEFILVSDLDTTGVERILGELPDKLARRTGLSARVVASSPCYSSDRLWSAYQEARTALLMRPLAELAQPGDSSGLSAPPVRKRVSPEFEKRLAFALESRNKALAREVIFDEIGFGACERSGWLLVEAKQTAEYVAGMIYHRADPGPGASPKSMLAMDNLDDLLAMALEEGDIEEARSVLEQILEESFGESIPHGANDTMRGVARKAQGYVDEHYFEDISLTSVAELFGVDRSYLSKAFKQVTGCNIMLAIAKRRIEKAMEYIRRGELSLADIADLVGYGEYAYFNRVFRKIAGMSPSEYKASPQDRMER